MDHVNLKSRSSSGSKNNNAAKPGCEKASRRFRTILMKASRLGVSTAEIAKLPTTKKLFPQRDNSYRLVLFLFILFAVAVLVAVVRSTRRTCTKIEDINIAT